MAKYIYGRPQSTRIAGSGEYTDEWIEIRRVKWNDAQRMSGATEAEQKNALIPFITDWSIVDESGAKVPINVETIAELPIEIVLPATQYFNELFLGLAASVPKKSGNSKN